MNESAPTASRTNDIPRSRRVDGRGKATMRRGLTSAATAIAAIPALAHATVVPPAGVSAYRLLFVTADGTSAGSANISTYNSFVNTEAALSAGLPSSSWSAIGSTAALDAVTNIDCGAPCNALPIYLPDGVEVAADSTALFGGTLLNPIAVDQYGDSIGYTKVWTGTDGGGIATAGAELGASSGTTYGLATATDSTAFDFFIDACNGSSGSCTPTSNYSMYAISQEIDVPEPVTGPAILLGGVIAMRVLRRRR